MFNYKEMELTQWVHFNYSDLENKDLYSKTYFLKKEIKKSVFKNNERNKSFNQILKQCVDNDSKRLYSIEIKKVYEYLTHNENSGNYCLLSEDLDNHTFKSGVMNSITTQALQEYEGISRIEIEQFKYSLFNAIEDDVDLIYVELEKNLSGRFDWKKK